MSGDEKSSDPSIQKKATRRLLVKVVVVVCVVATAAVEVLYQTRKSGRRIIFRSIIAL